MRLAFVDLEFSWPPPGGAQIDLMNTMTELKRLGHEVHLFCPIDQSLWRFGTVDAEAFPHPVTQLPCARKPFVGDFAERLREAVDAWRPDAVFLCFGFYLKARLASVLSHYPIISRYYTYEMFCLRDFYLFKDETTCPNSFLATPDVCRRCFVRSWRQGIVRGELSSYAQELLALEGLDPRFHAEWSAHMRSLDAIIVYNEMTRARLLPFNDNVHVVTGGVRLPELPFTPLPQREAADKKIIFMAGRADDHLKGVGTLLNACDILAAHRDDFEVWVTLSDPTRARPWLRCIGWQSHAQVIERYKQSDICVVPSLWDEPFGLVAAEAMAIGRPVCVSRVGGLQHIPIEGETGFVFGRDDYVELSFQLERLLDDADLRARMGQAGRRRAEEVFDWEKIVARRYPAILESVTR